MKQKPRIGKAIESLGNILMLLIFIAGLVVAYYFYREEQFYFAAAAILGGLAVGYVSTLFIRGFGRLVDNTDRIRELMELLTWNKDVMNQVPGAKEEKTHERAE